MCYAWIMARVERIELSILGWKPSVLPLALHTQSSFNFRKMLISIVSCRIFATSTWAAQPFSGRGNHLIELIFSDMFHTLVTLNNISDGRIHLRACDSVSKDFSNVNRNNLRCTIQSVLSFGCMSFIMSFINYSNFTCFTFLCLYLLQLNHWPQTSSNDKPDDWDRYPELPRLVARTPRLELGTKRWQRLVLPLELYPH